MPFIFGRQHPRWTSWTLTQLPVQPPCFQLPSQLSLTPPSASAQNLTSPFPLDHPKAPKHICLGVAKVLLHLLNDKIVQESLLDIYKQKHKNKYMKFLGQKNEPMTDPWLYWPDYLSVRP